MSKDLVKKPSFPVIPWKGWKMSTVKKVCSRTDHTGTAVLRKPGSGTGRPATASACTVCRFKTIFPFVGPTKLYNNVSKTLIVKSQTAIDCLQYYRTLRHAIKKMTSFPKSCILIFWVNRLTQNLTGWKRWVLVEKLTPLVNICGYKLPTNLQNFT